MIKKISIGLTLLILIIALWLWLRPAQDSITIYKDDAEKSAVTVYYKDDAEKSSVTYTGGQSCIECHQKEYDYWQGSHHDLAMQKVSEKTVLGNFDNATYTNFGVTSNFYKKDTTYFVYTEGPDGELAEFKIAYVFGIDPLQQYLIEFPKGRMQVLPLCWDTRPENDGGQRWFHIYPDERIAPDDILYWTRITQNWNFMCADCHSTNLKKNYDMNKDQYETTWSEIDVSCEACHGPGSAHIAWAENLKEGEKIDVTSKMGLVVRLKDLSLGTWVFDDETGNAKRTTPLSSNTQIEVCAPCHARRTRISANYDHAQPLLDAYQPNLLGEGMYFADGQILDEVYVYGSFLQSKMYHQGVVCSDCHEPHGLNVYAQDNALCYRCHLYEKLGTREHHFHNPDSTGASCVECHMPERTYMVVDPRRDHSIRIPRPDLSAKLNTPNACTLCHSDKSVQWAVDAYEKWYGKQSLQKFHYGISIAAGRSFSVDAQDGLVALVSDSTTPNIVRATALTLLRNYPSPASVETLQKTMFDVDPLIRLTTLNALQILPPNERFTVAKHMLRDPVKAVRIEAAHTLLDIADARLSGSDRNMLNEGINEYLQAQIYNADHPAANLNMGAVYVNQGKFSAAESAYQRAIDIEPGYVFAYVNLADLYRQQGKEEEGKIVLQQGLEINADVAELHHALGLLHVRQKNLDQALISLEKAATLNQDNPSFSYTYAIALNSGGNTPKALEVLESAHIRHPANRDILYALATINSDQNDIESALKFTNKLIKIDPQNTSYLQLLQQLRTRQ
jgi:tetratricopeptide (TPR) repeat protein